MFWDPRHCLHAHITMSSGAKRESMVKRKRRFLTPQFSSLWKDMFGCIETHVQAMVVERQLHTMFHMSRVECSPETTETLMSDVKLEVKGAA